MPDVGREVDAFSFVFDNVPYIAVDMSKTPERRRFDIAHEIGHLVMHATSLTESGEGSVMWRKERMNSLRIC